MSNIDWIQLQQTANDMGATPPFNPPRFPTPYYGVLSKYELPLEAKAELDAMQSLIEVVGDNPPTTEQWLKMREHMLKFWAIMVTKALTMDAELNAKNDTYNLALQMEIERMKQEKAYQLYKMTTTY